MKLLITSTGRFSTAEDQCDVLLRQAFKTSLTLLSTAHYILGCPRRLDLEIYPYYDIKHPYVTWILQTDMNYIWMYDLAVAYYDTLTYRNKHSPLNGNSKVFENLYSPPSLIPMGSTTEFPNIFSKQSLIEGSRQETRNLFKKWKTYKVPRYPTWTNQSPPVWLTP